MKSKPHRSRLLSNSHQQSRLRIYTLVMKLACVAHDRVDIAEAVKCLTRLKRLGRYLVKKSRCVLTYARQTSDATLQVHVGSDWAGDLLGRKSTTGVTVRRSKFLLRHMSCLHTLVALSSGEAEYCALTQGACTSLGIQSHYQDWMIDVPIQNLQWQCSSKECRKKMWNWRSSETFADTTLVAAVSSSSWSLEIGCRCRRAESSRHAHEIIARSQDSRVVRRCWREMVALKHLQG